MATLDPAEQYTEGLRAKPKKKGKAGKPKQLTAQDISGDPLAPPSAADTAAAEGQGSPAWQKLVDKVGIKKASEQQPELDPRYQGLVKTEGQAKGSRDYSRQVLDPETLSAQPGLNPLAQGKDSALTRGIIAMQQSKNPWEVGAGQLAQTFDLTDAAGLAGKDFPDAKQLAAAQHHPPPPPPPGLTAQQSGTAATEALFNSLVGQYQGAMAAVDPYINGTVATQDEAKASQIGQSIGGPTGPQPAAAAGINAELAGDASAYAKANDAGAAGIASALGGMGQANAANLAASPYQALIQGALAGSSYNIEKGTLPPAYSGKNMPAWATQIIANTVGGAPAGTAAPSNVPLVTPGGGQAAAPSTDQGGTSQANSAGT